MFVKQFVLIKIFFDIIVIKSNDFAHFEYDNLCKQFHHLFLNIIITLTTTQTYVIAIRHWFFASNFARIQFSIYHFKNYNLFEHAEWIVILFAFFRCWLKKHRFQQYYLIARQRHLFANFIDFIATQIITRIFVVIARNTFMLMTNKSINKTKFTIIVKKIKNEFQLLLKIVAFVANMNSKSKFWLTIFIRSNEINDDHVMTFSYTNITTKTQKYRNDQKYQTCISLFIMRFSWQNMIYHVIATFLWMKTNINQRMIWFKIWIQQFVNYLLS